MWSVFLVFFSSYSCLSQGGRAEGRTRPFEFETLRQQENYRGGERKCVESRGNRKRERGRQGRKKGEINSVEERWDRETERRREREWQST